VMLVPAICTVPRTPSSSSMIPSILHFSSS
jgi:hypothetical protein